MDRLPPEYDDILAREDATGVDAELMARGCRYDYTEQAWLDGHDHAHMVSNDDSAPLLFCGANLAACGPDLCVESDPVVA